MNYRGFTLAELEQEYSPSSMIGGDLTPQLLSYRALSGSKCKKTCPTGLIRRRFWISFPPHRPERRCISLFTEDIGRPWTNATRR